VGWSSWTRSSTGGGSRELGGDPSLTEGRARRRGRERCCHGDLPSTRPTRLDPRSRVYLDVADARTGAAAEWSLATPHARVHGEEEHDDAQEGGEHRAHGRLRFPELLLNVRRGRALRRGRGGRGRVRAVPPRPRVRARDEVDGDQHEHRAPRERHDARARAERGRERPESARFPRTVNKIGAGKFSDEASVRASAVHLLERAARFRAPRALRRDGLKTVFSSSVVTGALLSPRRSFG